jgi:glutamine amidotransferase
MRVAIVDYGLGNLFSVKQACEASGFRSTITSSPEEIRRSDVVILPGVGAFGDAMAALEQRNLIDQIREVADSEGRLLVGICLGMQLLLSDSSEFGRHEGLNIVRGSVRRLRVSRESNRLVKVPQVGWNRIYKKDQEENSIPWSDTLLRGMADGEYMYFVHSYYADPEDPNIIISWTKYGDLEFCSSLMQGNVFATQFHPERSGIKGLAVYRNILETMLRIKERQLP